MKYLPIILTLIVIGGLAWYFNQNYIANVKSPTSTSALPAKTPPTITPKLEKTTSEKLVFASQNNQGTTIASVSANGENQKTLFTDKDEADKIKEVNTITSLTHETPMIVGDNRLVSVKLDGSSKKEILIDSLGNPSSVSLSPDGKTVSFVAFSNVEVDYGYTLYICSRQGEGLRGLLRNEKEMKNPIWNTDGSQIYYLQISDNQTAVMRADVVSGRSQSIFQTSDDVYSLNFSAGKLVFSSGPKNKNISAIYQMDTGGQNLKKLLEDTGIIYNPFLSSDNLNLAYLFSGDVTNKPSGDIVVASADGKNKKKIIQGNYILGWIN